MVRPHLEDASVVWPPLYKKDKITLENTQRRATTRLIPSLKGMPYLYTLKALRVVDAGIQAREGRHGGRHGGSGLCPPGAIAFLLVTDN